MEEKKSTYNATAQKKYNEKRKALKCTVMNDKYNIIVEHAKRKGFASINSYILSLINKDLKGE